jgi:DNA-binding transcriptional MerR regulator
MAALTIHEAAATTGWSARMLRYLERVGLIAPSRSAGGYRVFGAAELQRLRTLRELLAEHDLGLSDVAFAKRLRDDPRLAEAVAGWLDARPRRPESVPTSDWLRFEQDKCRRLLAASAA